MSVDRSTRTLLAAFFLLAALFVAMNRVVESAALLDWWLPLLLFIVGVALALAPNLRLIQPQVEAEPETDDDLALNPPDARIYRVTATAGGETVITDETAAAAGILPFISETATLAPPSSEAAPITPETPAPDAEPEPEVEQAPVTPETPAPAVESEPEVMSPETPTPQVEAETGVMLPKHPSQSFPVERAQDTGEPAPELSYSARTEYAEPDAAVAKNDAPAEPPAEASTTESERTEPEKEVVADKTSAPQQPYEAEQVGDITPERAERVMDEATDNAHDDDVPARTEAASARVTAQENGEGTVGKPDDLVVIKGIGPKSAAALVAAGIDSFQKLANTSEAALVEALQKANVRLVGEVTTWAQQAAYAARGDWEGFDRFNAGGSASGE